MPNYNLVAQPPPFNGMTSQQRYDMTKVPLRVLAEWEAAHGKGFVASRSTAMMPEDPSAGDFNKALKSLGQYSTAGRPQSTNIEDRTLSTGQVPQVVPTNQTRFSGASSMASNFSPMGGVPDFYRQLMQQAQQGLVRMPDGSYAPAPQFGSGGNVNDLYRGILPTPRTVTSMRVNPNGSSYGADPIGDRSSFQQLDDEAANTWPAPRYGGPPDSLGQTSNERRTARLSVPQPPPMPQRGLPGSSGTANGNQGLMAIASLLGIPQASGTVNQSKSQDRLPATPALLAYNGDTGPLVPLPRVRPTPPMMGMPPLPRIRPQPPMNMGATNLAPPGVSGVLDPTFPVDNSIPLNLPQPPASVVTAAQRAVPPAPPKRKPQPTQAGPGNTIYNNPGKYGATKQERQAAAQRRAALTAFGGN